MRYADLIHLDFILAECAIHNNQQILLDLFLDTEMQVDSNKLWNMIIYCTVCSKK